MSFSRPSVGVLQAMRLSRAADEMMRTSEQGPRDTTAVQPLLPRARPPMTRVPAPQDTGLPGGSHGSCPALGLPGDSRALAGPQARRTAVSPAAHTQCVLNDRVCASG